MEIALTRYGIRLRRISRDYLRGACPLPTHQSQASNQSFIVNTAKNVWSCQSASCIAARGGSVGGNVLDFVALMGGCSIRDAALSLQQAFGSTASLGGFHPQKHAHVFGFQGLPRFAEHAMPKPLSFVLSGIDCRHPYLAERGINRDVARLFGVGHYARRGIMSGRIVIPIHSPDGALVAYVGRSIDAREPRYKFPPGFRKSHFLFNLHRAIKARLYRSVIVVEGFFDCMNVHQAGYPCVVAAMGSSLSSEQANLLKQNFAEVILMLDGDASGRVGTMAIENRLRHMLVVRVASVPIGRQPDQLSEDEINSVLAKVSRGHRLLP